MALADRDSRTRERTECARCHTTWGSLGEPERRPPAEVGALGLGCVACHDIHDPSGSPPHAAPSGLRPALLRHPDVRAALPGAPPAADGASRVCIGCHAPGNGPLPEASAAAIWAGLGGVDPETGEALVGPEKHARNSLDASRGCLACHASGPPTLERGARHAFEAGSKSCLPCHREAPERRPEIAAAARALVGELLPSTRGRASTEPPHALPFVAALSPAKNRALRNALLVLEDPAADVHNLGYARRLLDASLKALGRNPVKQKAEARP
jgi:hypothetical protein